APPAPRPGTLGDRGGRPPGPGGRGGARAVVGRGHPGLPAPRHAPRTRDERGRVDRIPGLAGGGPAGTEGERRVAAFRATLGGGARGGGAVGGGRTSRSAVRGRGARPPGVGDRGPGASRQRQVSPVRTVRRPHARDNGTAPGLGRPGAVVLPCRGPEGRSC